MLILICRVNENSNKVRKWQEATKYKNWSILSILHKVKVNEGWALR